METLSQRQLIAAFLGVPLAMLLAALDRTIVATALPRIAGDLHGFQRLSGVVTAYLLATTITVPLYARAALAASLHTVYLAAAPLVAAALAVSLLLREIPLRGRAAESADAPAGLEGRP